MTRVKIAVMGGMGDGTNIAGLIDSSFSITGQPLEFIGLLNDREEVGALVDGFPVIGNLEEAIGLKNEGVKFVSCIVRINQNEERINRVSGLGLERDDFITVIHPSAYLARSAIIGRGCVIYPGVTIFENAKIGDMGIIQAKANIGHHTKIGDFNKISAGAIVGSYIETKKGVHVGTNSVVIERLTIGEMSSLGSGGVLTKSIPDREIWVGNPAKFLRTAT